MIGNRGEIITLSLAILIYLLMRCADDGRQFPDRRTACMREH